MDYETDWVTVEIVLIRGKKEVVIGNCQIRVADLSKEAFSHPQVASSLHSVSDSWCSTKNWPPLPAC